MDDPAKVWFPAKRYGWGWGLPRTWQGWTVLAAYIALVVGAMPWREPRVRSVPFVLYVLALTAALGLVCWLKGEPPRWRWGDDD